MDASTWGRRIVGMALLIGTIALAAPPSLGHAASATYAVANLGLPKGSTATWALALNNTGLVVGRDAPTGATQQSQTSRPVAAAPGKPFALLESPATPGQALGVNDAGQIVGWVGDAANPAAEHAVIWAKGKRQELPTLGGDESAAGTINVHGVAAGMSSLAPGADSPIHAVVWEQGAAIDLGTLGGADSDAAGINDAGQVVGISTTDKGGQLGAPGTHSFFWDGKTMTDLGTLGGDIVEASALNNKGVVVGLSTKAPGQALTRPNARPFVWQDGKMSELPMLKGSAGCWAAGINDAGLIVGTCMSNRSPNGSTGVLWRNGKIIELNTLIPRDSGWFVADAYAINTHGEIAGDGIKTGVAHLQGLALNPTK